VELASRHKVETTCFALSMKRFHQKTRHTDLCITLHENRLRFLQTVLQRFIIFHANQGFNLKQQFRARYLLKVVFQRKARFYMGKVRSNIWF